MLQLLYEPLPDSVEIAGKAYRIRTDFREWLRFSEMCTDKALLDSVRLQMLPLWFLDAPPVIDKQAVTALREFYTAKALSPPPHSPEAEAEEQERRAMRPPVLDWCLDAAYLIGDFRRLYRMDLLRTEYLHWWEFRALVSALPDTSVTVQRMQLRSRDLGEIKDRKLRAKTAAAQRRIAIPFELDDEMIAAAFH